MPRYTEVADLRPVPATGFIARPIPGRPFTFDLFAWGGVFARVTLEGAMWQGRCFRYEDDGGFYPDETAAPDFGADTLPDVLALARELNEAQDADDDWVDVDALVERAIEASNDHWAWTQGDSDPYAGTCFGVF